MWRIRKRNLLTNLHIYTHTRRHTHTLSAWTRFIPTLHILARVCVLKCIVVFSHTSLFDVSFVRVNKRRLMNGGGASRAEALVARQLQCSRWPLMDKLWTAQRARALTHETVGFAQVFNRPKTIIASRSKRSDQSSISCYKYSMNKAWCLSLWWMIKCSNNRHLKAPRVFPRLVMLVRSNKYLPL